MKTKSQISKSAVLHAFSVEANPNANTLAIYLTRYPSLVNRLLTYPLSYSRPPL